MPNNVLKIAIVFVGLLFLSLSCGNRRNEVKNERIKNISDKDLLDSILSLREVPFHFFYSKIGIDIRSAKQNNSFKASVKMNVDSAFSGTLSIAGFIGATYLVSQDSAQFTDKNKKCYRAESLSYLTGLFGTEIDYDFFQSLILGQPLAIDSSIKYKRINSKQHYILSSHKKRKIKNYSQDPEKAEDDEIMVQYVLNPDNFQLRKVNIQVPQDTVKITIDYAERKPVEGFDFDFPEETKIKIITANDSTEISLNYGTIRLNSKKRIGINIPASYAECE